MGGALDTERCIGECLDCAGVCEAAAAYCRERGGRFAERGRISALVRCAAFSRLVADYLLDDAELPRTAMVLYIEACESCVDACEALGDADPPRACAEQARVCVRRIRGAFAHAEVA